MGAVILAQESRKDLAPVNAHKRHTLPGRLKRTLCWLKQPRPLRLLSATLGLLALAAGIGLISLPLIVALAARQMPAGTMIRRLALAIMALFGLNAALLTVLAMAEVPVETRMVAAVYLVGFAIAPEIRDGSKARGRIATVSDWWALSTALVTFVVFYHPFVGASLGRSMAQLSFSTDGANHLTFVRRSLGQGGYLAASDYPPAWAGNMALVIDVVGDASPRNLLLIAPPLIMAFYALLVFFAVALTLDVLHAVVGKHSHLAAFVAVCCIVFISLVGVGNFMIRTSSYTQTVAMTALVVITTLLLAERDHATWRMPVMMGLLTVTLMQTWYLLAPVLLGMLFLYLILLRPKPPLVVAVAVPTVFFSAYPLLKGPPPVTQINAMGITPLPHPTIVLALLVLTLVAVAILIRRNSSGGSAALSITTLVVTSLMLCVLVGAIQVSTGTGLGYYAAKVLYAVFLFGALAAATAAGLETERGLRAWSQPDSGPWLSSALLAFLVFAGLAAASVGTRDQSWSLAAGRAPDAFDGTVLDAMFAAHPDGLPLETDAWVFDRCFPGTDYLANKWIHDLFQTWNESRYRVSNGFRSGRERDLSALLSRAAENEVQRMEIYIHRACDPDAIANLARSPKVVLVRVGD